MFREEKNTKNFNSSPPRGSNSQPSDHHGTPPKSLTLYPIELGGHVKWLYNIFGSWIS
jgi:hypothetical protein